MRHAQSVSKRTDAERSRAHPRAVKPEIVMQASSARHDDVSRIHLSAVAVLKHEIAKLSEWLTAQGLDPQNEYAHADEGSRDRLYLRYGLFIGLKQALALLTNQGQTVH